MSTRDGDDAPEDEIATDIVAWADAHGFAASERPLAGQTPLLRSGMADITADAYEGQVAGRDALLAELSVVSPGLSDAFGGSGVDDSWFTVFAVTVDRPDWRRLVVRPRHLSEGDWLARLRGEEHRVHELPRGVDERYHVLAARGIPGEQLHALFDDEVTAALVRHGDVVVELETDDLGTTLVVARQGIGLSEAELDALQEQARVFTERVEAA